MVDWHGIEAFNKKIERDSAIHTASIKYPQENFLSLKGEIPSKTISELLGDKINLHINLQDKTSGAEQEVHKARIQQYTTQQNLISGAIKQEKQLLDFSRINLVNFSADQARIEGNTKKYLGLGILGAVLLG
jgi:hypothetical protein